jgi:glycosyltransferase involved in cell wall biosynthesis
MRPSWESGLRGRLYALGRRAIPIAWRRALRRRVSPERILGIRKPPVEVPRFDFEPAPPQPGREDVVVLPVIAWTYRRQRPQQLAEALARRGRRIFYGSLRGTGEPEEPAGVAPGVMLLPIAGVRREDPSDRRLEAGALAEALAGLERSRARFDLREVAVLVQSPFWGPLALAARDRWGWRVVYDCLDAHEQFSTNRPRILADAERSLAAEADLVVATSEALRDRMAAWNPASQLLPNACDYALFGRLPPPRPVPGRLTVGYVGAVDEWFDIELLAAIARLRPAWRFEVVGGLEAVALAVPPDLPNVAFFGERPHREMPDFRSRFDVEIIPFRLSPLTHATNPVKLYEAAAAGRSVVATPMESLEPFCRRGLVRLAATPEDFVRQIEDAAAHASEASGRLRAFARENTWDIRAAALETWLTGPRGRGTVGAGREQ